MRNLFKSLLPILLIISMIVTMGVESLSIDNPIPEDGANQEKIPIQTIGEDIKEEEPKAEEPKVGSPKVDKPKEELPKLDKPIEQAPKAEEPKAEGPNKEELKVEAPKVEEPEAEPPKVDEIEKEKAVNLTSKVNGVTVVISAEPGVLPNDTILDVKALSDKDSKNYSEAIMEKTGTSLDNFKLFDITLLDNEKNEIQPKGNVEVSFSGVDFIKDSEEIVVYHLESNTAKKGIGLNQLNVDIKADEMKIETNNDKVTFNTDHFSIYGVGDKATATYNFKVDSAEVDQQIVLNGEYLKEPQTPAKQANIKFDNNQGQTGDKNTEPVIVIPTQGGFTIIKVDKADNSIKLPGAEFKLTTDEAGNTPVVAPVGVVTVNELAFSGDLVNLTTNADGKVVITGLPAGTYYLHETKAPTYTDDGVVKPYRLLTKPLTVKVTSGDAENNVTVENAKSGWNLPTTGGMGTILFTFIGIAFMGIAFFLFSKNKRVEN